MHLRLHSYCAGAIFKGKAVIRYIVIFFFALQRLICSGQVNDPPLQERKPEVRKHE